MNENDLKALVTVLAGTTAVSTYVARKLYKKNQKLRSDLYTAAILLTEADNIINNVQFSDIISRNYN